MHFMWVSCPLKALGKMCLCAQLFRWIRRGGVIASVYTCRSHAPFVISSPLDAGGKLCLCTQLFRWIRGCAIHCLVHARAHLIGVTFSNVIQQTDYAPEGHTWCLVVIVKIFVKPLDLSFSYKFTFLFCTKSHKPLYYMNLVQLLRHIRCA